MEQNGLVLRYRLAYPLKVNKKMTFHPSVGEATRAVVLVQTDQSFYSVQLEMTRRHRTGNTLFFFLSWFPTQAGIETVELILPERQIDKLDRQVRLTSQIAPPITSIQIENRAKIFIFLQMEPQGMVNTQGCSVTSSEQSSKWSPSQMLPIYRISTSRNATAIFAAIPFGNPLCRPLQWLLPVSHAEH